MLILITVVHVVVCIFLIIVVLLQSGKAADLAGAFGGMGSQTAFGPRGSATLLSKATTASAIVFMITSLTLSILATRGSTGVKTVLDTSSPASQRVPAKASTPAQAAHGATPGRQTGAAPDAHPAAGAPGATEEVATQCGGGGIGRRTSLRC